MIRRILPLALLAPLLIVTAIAIRSRFAGEVLSWQTPRASMVRLTQFIAERGGVGVQFTESNMELEAKGFSWKHQDPGVEAFSIPTAGRRSGSSGQFLGFMWAIDLDISGFLFVGRLSTIIAPTWALFVASAIPPAIVLPRIVRRRRRIARHQCLACGYDLRASPDRCPECGAPAGADRTLEV